MKSIRQLFRRPVKTSAGIILIALAVLILSVCTGQYMAAKLTRQEVEDNYSTVAFPTAVFNAGATFLPSEYTEWIEDTAAEHPELVTMISDSKLLSAYVPELSPLNYTDHYITSNTFSIPFNPPHSCAMLAVRLTDISTETVAETRKTVTNGVTEEFTRAVSVQCKGVVEAVIALQEGHPSPIGYTINLTFTACDEATLKTFDLEVGQRYLVYGMDYFDNDWEFRRQICKNQANFDSPFDIEKVYETAPDGTYLSDSLGTVFYYYENIIGSGDDAYTAYVAFDSNNLSMLKNCQLTVCDYSSLPWMFFDTSIFSFTMRPDERPLLEDEYSSSDLAQDCTIIPAEEFIALYALPTVVKLEGTAEEFLASEDAALWLQALSDIEINNHAFPVLAVDKLSYQAEFSREQVRIVDGRDFTQKELINGENVCIIAESLAAANGLTVGDTISLRTMEFDPNIAMNEHYTKYDTAYFDAIFYSNVRGFSGDTKQFTIVGLYRQDNAWSYDSAYGFTPNTVFIPKSAASGKMFSGTGGVFRTVILKNGAQDAFQSLVKEAGYDGLFVYYDQGYAEIASSLDAYETVSSRAFYVGIGAYIVILILFLLLFPAQQRKALNLMSSLGAARRHKLAHIMIHSTAIIAIGTIIGGVAGALLLDSVIAKLMESVGVTVVMSSVKMIIPIIATIQLIFAVIALLLIAVPLSRRGNLIKRK